MGARVVRERLTAWARACVPALNYPRVLAAIPVLFFSLVMAGVIRAYTPVPSWDMWDGAVQFYFDTRDGVRGALTHQHNEHRIVFSKLLFWLDIHYFGARAVFLAAAHIVLGLLIWGTFCAVARPLIADRRLWAILCCGLGVFSFSWMQQENFTSAFQSQFFAAVLFPLLAFACLAMTAAARRPWLWFAAAIAGGVASLGTMVNGLLAFPLLVIMQIALGAWMPRRIVLIRALILTTIGIAAVALWFRTYTFPDAAEAPALGDILVLALTFMGVPFSPFSAGVAAGIVGGLVFGATTVALFVRWWRARAQFHPLVLALFAMIAFVGATGLMVAYGRASITADASAISRYATPALAAWCAMLSVAAAVFQRRPRAVRLFAGVTVASALLFLPAQLNALGDDGPRFQEERMHGALALMLDIYDPVALSKIYQTPMPELHVRLRAAAGRLAAGGRSTFADPRWDDARARLGSSAAEGFHPCEGMIEQTRALPDSSFRAVSGWMFDPAARPPRFVYFAHDGRIAGLAVTGAPRPDVVRVKGRRAYRGGFDGYVAAPDGAVVAIVCSNDPA